MLPPPTSHLDSHDRLPPLDRWRHDGASDAEEAAHLIGRVVPQRVVPVHHHTFSHYAEPVTALVKRLAGTGFAESLRVAEEGEVVVLD